jgi:hypothetical protein
MEVTYFKGNKLWLPKINIHGEWKIDLIKFAQKQRDNINFNSSPWIPENRNYKSETKIEVVMPVKCKMQLSDSTNSTKVLNNRLQTGRKDCILALERRSQTGPCTDITLITHKVCSVFKWIRIVFYKYVLILYFLFSCLA